MTDRTPLDRLLKPESVAIVGLSADSEKHGARILHNLRRFGFGGEIWGVNPSAQILYGIKTVASTAEIPGSPDVVVLAVPNGLVAESLEQAALIGAGGAIILGGGFSEAGAEGIERQREITAIAQRHGIRLLGPNSAGIIDASRRTVLSFLTCLERAADDLRPGPVGLVAQSGGSASYLHNLAGERGGGLAVSISTGNEADLGAGEAIDQLLDRDDIRAIALLLETVRDGDAFVAACARALEKGVPVVVCKVGTSVAGAEIMQTHTGALASPWRRFAAVFDALGITVTRSPEELFDVAELMARAPIPRGTGVGVVTHSGGTAVLLADKFEEENVALPEPSIEMQEGLAEFLQHGAAKNPTDLGGIITAPHRFGEVVARFARDGDFPTVIEVSTPHPVAHTEARVQSLLDLAATTTTPIIHLWLAGDLGRHGLAMLREANAPVSVHVDSVVRGVGGLGRISERRADGARTVADPDDAARNLVAAAAAAGPRLLSENDSKALLAGLGIPVARNGTASTSAEARGVADGLGYPVVVKLISSTVVHKSDLGGVHLNVRDGDGVEKACRAIDEALASARHPGGEGYLVEEFIPGTEVVLGIMTDPVFGPFVMVGIGGVQAEAINDVAIGYPPLSETTALHMIRSLRGYRLLTGFRGSEPTDEIALAALVARLGLIAVQHRGVIDEVDLNPVVFSGGEWRAADAVVRIR